jgi:predicted HicB family RNase H-like nuclease
MLSYKGYLGHVIFDEEADIFHGEVVNTRDVITFQGNSVASLKKAFKDSVNDYLEFCKERGEEPEKPFSGKFNVRIDPALHREAYVAAKTTGMSLNNWVTRAIQHEAKATNGERAA